MYGRERLQEIRGIVTDPFKKIVRQSLRHIRANLSLDFQHKASGKICNRIKQLPQYRHAKRIALYHAANGEANVDAIWRSAPLHGKFCYFPAITADKRLLFLPATPATPFRDNRYGIGEPDVANSLALAPRDIDIIFMPLVGFDRYGTRLGMGAGYYDRTLAQENHPLLIGVAYEFQRLPFIARDAWDIPLQAVITEQNTYWSQP